MDDIRDVTGLVTDHTAYTAIDGVLRAFRRRLTSEQTVRFAQVLPAVPRAIVVREWDIAAPSAPWIERAALIDAVRGLRRNRTIAPAKAIEAAARAVWRRINHADLRRVLSGLGPQAQAFRAVPDADPADLATRIA